MANSPEGADYRLTVWSRHGTNQRDLTASFHCLWAVSPDIGTAYFTMATNDPTCTEYNLQFGNIILFEHEKLGSWAGYIAPHNQRKWSGEKQVTIPVLAYEAIFQRRRAGWGEPIRGTPGAVFRKLCQLANGKEDALIRFGGSIHGRGAPAGIPDPKGAMLSDLITDIVKKGRVNWWLQPRVNSEGRLVFDAYMAKRQGKNKGYVLSEGFNLETPTGDFYIEEGDIINDVVVTSQNAKKSNAPKGEARDKTSKHDYGLWEYSTSSTADDNGSPQDQADGILDRQKDPQKKFMLTALESPESPDTFKFIGTGDDVVIDLYSVGFYANSNGVTENARILSREYSTDDNKVVLVNEVQYAEAR